MSTRERFCIIGAGYAGLGLARAFTQAGIPYDQLEATDRIGGNWSHGVYDSTHLITSKQSTGYPEYPMPAHYPTFPSRLQMLRYLQDYAEHFHLHDHLELSTEVVQARPLDRDGMSGWTVELASGEVREYAGVLVANGHYFEPHTPTYPGTFTGRQLHSKDYKRPADFGVGDRVLVVGAGNSASDLAVEAASTFGRADISMRGGYWFMPKTFLGIPASDWDQRWLPAPLLRAGTKVLLRMSYGDYRRYGLPKPDHPLFSKDVTVSSSLMYALQHGRVRPRPEIAEFAGSTVHFVDGTSGEYDTILWATGYRTRFPFLDESMFVWENGQPLLIEHVLVPRYANIVIWGLVAPRAGAGPLISRGSDLLAEQVLLQRLFPVPLSDLAAQRVAARSSILAGSGELLARMRLMRLGLRMQVGLARQLGTDRAVRRRPASPSPRHTLSIHESEEDVA